MVVGLLLATAPAWGQKVSGQKWVRTDKSAVLSVKVEDAGEDYVWISATPGLTTMQGGDSLVRQFAALDLPVGRHVFVFTSFDKHFTEAFAVTVNDKQPKPDDPLPPPDPDDDPDDDDPQPTPPPISEPGFRVLIVYESGEMTKYPIETGTILAGGDVRKFLGANCVPGSNGVPEYRIYDADMDTAHDSPLWQKAMKRPRSQTPWVIISNGKTGFEGPLPKTPSEFLELCKKYLPTTK